MEICPNCGLPRPACVCEQITKGTQRVNISTDKKRYGKIVTVVSGFEKDVNVKKIARALKNELACGGTHKEGMIELQGDHTKRVKEILNKLGFEAE
jgi:translation initiation factor 1